MTVTLELPPVDDAGVLSDVRSLDERIRALGLKIWIGGEPTFTDRFSEAPEWLHSALGGDKERRAEALLRELAGNFPGCALLRTLGRQYPGEAIPRWSLGLYARRDGAPVWEGPPDPLLATGPCTPWSGERLGEALEAAVAGRGWSGFRFTCETAPRQRLLLRLDGAPCNRDALPGEALCRPSVHDGPIPAEGLHDPLADAGYCLIGFDAEPEEAGGWPWLELPRVAVPRDFLELLSALAEACTDAGLNGVRLRGHPPPVDRRIHWSTITPDPAVIEANLAPAASLEELHSVNRRLFEAAERVGLAPFRLQYNGRQTDSGGGGQLTIGGPTPEASPFFVEPQLLPRLVRYFNRHPSLSYWLATDYIGGGSQAPRCDEGPRELFTELGLALEQLGRRPFPDPAFIWGSLAPFMADAGGNSHRSEINIEKLWNPYLGERGRQGLVELRPFRMAPSLEALSAYAALVRALVARLMRFPYDAPLVDWGGRLHTRFGLPFYLKRDLQYVLDDLEAKGLGLGESLAATLLDDGEWEFGRREWNGVTVRLLRAQEFWPLIGDRSSQRPADSRLVDASTVRRELSLSAPEPRLLADFELRIDGRRVPLRTESGRPATRLTGIRYRSFVPWQGLHPALPPQPRIEIALVHLPSARALMIELFEWRPDGGPYAGLPEDRKQAAERRAERVVTREVDAVALPPPLPAPKEAVSEYCVDLRRM